MMQGTFEIRKITIGQHCRRFETPCFGFDGKTRIGSTHIADQAREAVFHIRSFCLHLPALKCFPFPLWLPHPIHGKRQNTQEPGKSPSAKANFGQMAGNEIFSASSSMVKSRIDSDNL